MLYSLATCKNWLVRVMRVMKVCSKYGTLHQAEGIDYHVFMYIFGTQLSL